MAEEFTGDPRFKKVLDDLWVLHCKKARDYGANKDKDILANIRRSEEWGIPAWVGAMIRGCDKIKRLQSYVENGSLACEGVEDSLMDLAAYSIIALVLYKEKSDKSVTKAYQAITDPKTEAIVKLAEKAASDDHA